VGDGEGERRRLRGGSGGEEERSGPAAAAAARLVASGLELGISAEAILAWGRVVWSGGEGYRRTREKMGI